MATYRVVMTTYVEVEVDDDYDDRTAIAIKAADEICENWERYSDELCANLDLEEYHLTI